MTQKEFIQKLLQFAKESNLNVAFAAPPDLMTALELVTTKAHAERIGDWLAFQDVEILGQHKSFDKTEFRLRLMDDVLLPLTLITEIQFYGVDYLTTNEILFRRDEQFVLDPVDQALLFLCEAGIGEQYDKKRAFAVAVAKAQRMPLMARLGVAIGVARTVDTIDALLTRGWLASDAKALHGAILLHSLRQAFLATVIRWGMRALQRLQ